MSAVIPEETYVKKLTIVALEFAMLAGIALALFMVPRDTPLLTFGICSGGVFLLGNIALFIKARQVRSNPPAGLSAAREYCSLH